MINFPVLDRLDISDYGMFPGAKNAPSGLHVEFLQGLTLVLGANGLGKSTLVTIIYRVLTGPFDIPGLVGRAELGTIRLIPTALFGAARATLADRVADGARNAKARLSFKLGEHTVVIERNLSNLSLTEFIVDGKAVSTNEKESFQVEVAKLVGVWSFGDFILLLRHLMFYFEDRRALVWDASAQRQILRFLFLSAETARKWTEDERVILELDSRMRNLSAAVYREERALAADEVKIETGTDIREELKALEKLQIIDTERREQLDDEVLEVESRREHARLRFLQAEQERETRYRELERAKLTAIGSRFPDRSEIARYILAQLLTEDECLVCGNNAPAAAAEYGDRITQEKCVVCGSDLSGLETLVTATEMADKRVERASADLQAIEKEVAAARGALDDAESQYNSHFNEIAALGVKISERSRRIDALVRRLPPGEAELHKQRSELSAMRSRVEELRLDLDSKRQLFGGFIDEMNRDLVTRSSAIKEAFDRYAEGFLLEQCRLVWSPKRARLGETGDSFEFAAFELEMTGTDFPSPVRRTGPDHVSESQREFIDLAFRMALMEVGGSGGAGTLIIDAPESSLDAVFVTRAANVLARFANPTLPNRLVITSNLVEGQLIPRLVAQAMTSSDRGARVVDLFSIAEPTAAIKQLRGEYEAVRDALLSVLERSK